MGKWQITSKAGVDFGVYEGATAEEAFEAMVADGVDGDDSDGCSTAGSMNDWVITQVEDQ